MNNSNIKQWIDRTFNMHEENYYPKHQRIALMLAREFEETWEDTSKSVEDRIMEMGCDRLEAKCILIDAVKLFRQRSKLEKCREELKRLTDNESSYYRNVIDSK